MLILLLILFLLGLLFILLIYIRNYFYDRLFLVIDLLLDDVKGLFLNTEVYCYILQSEFLKLEIEQ